MQPRIPVEIVGLIIDIVAQAEKKLDDQCRNIKAWSLTCRAFLPQCRSHIFADINADSWNKLPNLCRLLKDSPWIGHYVPSLKLGLPYGFQRDLLSELPHLKNVVRLKSFFIDGHLSSWLYIPLPVQSIILHLMHLPTIDTIGFINISDMSPLHLAPCNLDSLTLDDESFDGKRCPARTIKCHRLFLKERKTITNTIKTLSKDQFDRRLLKCLHLTATTGMYQDSETLHCQLLTEMPFLEELEIRLFEDNFYYNFSSALASAPPTLKSLKICITIASLRDVPHLVKGIQQAADTVGHIVEHLTLNVLSDTSSIFQFPLVEGVLEDPGLAADTPISSEGNELKLRLYKFLEDRNVRFFYSITPRSFQERDYEVEEIDWQEMVWD
ncbi:hypothetical protein JR316_0006252 [Psilocybe cubensis]|uniref:Uncharacterized protein n=2 Tax=Psilocybe cubensis TaxID=181762 RepID=A0A8H7Y3P2_PSICU|nr:hypothetical protein JR316_0006252 [Psilocybe cubensis]KAH9481725.1 hypothetical protein JR316_0006252 [Psilocybe cubensis]